MKADEEIPDLIGVHQLADDEDVNLFPPEFIPELLVQLRKPAFAPRRRQLAQAVRKPELFVRRIEQREFVRMEIGPGANPLLSIDNFVPYRFKPAQTSRAYLVQENRRDGVLAEDGVD